MFAVKVIYIKFQSMPILGPSIMLGFVKGHTYAIIIIQSFKANGKSYMVLQINRTNRSSYRYAAALVRNALTIRVSPLHDSCTRDT